MTELLDQLNPTALPLQVTSLGSKESLAKQEFRADGIYNSSSQPSITYSVSIRLIAENNLS